MQQRFILLALASFLSTPVLGGECPTATTAKSGFVLERQGTLAEIRPSANHFVQVVNTYPGGKKQDVVYYRGLIQISRFDETTQSINIPVSDLRTIFPLDLKSKRAFTYAPARPSKVGALISLELTVQGQETLQLGACSYNVLAVHNRYLNAEGQVTSEHTDFYSPDLEFVLARRYDEKGGRSTSVRYQSIRPLDRNAPL